jgi:hypothetical protein
MLWSVSPHISSITSFLPLGRQAELVEYLKNFVLLSEEESHRFHKARLEFYLLSNFLQLSHRGMLRIFRNDLLVFFETPPTDTIVHKLVSYLKELNKCMVPEGSLKPCRNLQSTMRLVALYRMFPNVITGYSMDMFQFFKLCCMESILLISNLSLVSKSSNSYGKKPVTSSTYFVATVQSIKKRCILPSPI